MLRASLQLQPESAGVSAPGCFAPCAAVACRPLPFPPRIHPPSPRTDPRHVQSDAPPGPPHVSRWRSLGSLPAPAAGAHRRRGSDAGLQYRTEARPQATAHAPMPRSPTPEQGAARVSPVKSEGEPRVDDLPWLLPEQNARRVRDIRRIDELLQQSAVAPELEDDLAIDESLRQPAIAPKLEVDLAIDESLQQPEFGPELKEDLAFAAGLVLRVERDVLRAEQLHRALRSALLPEAEWLELSFLANRNRRDARLNQAELHGRFGRLLDSGALSTTDQLPVRGLVRRLAAAQQYWHANDTPFECTTRYIETALPTGSGASVRVQSRIVPGAALGVYFSAPYPQVGPLEPPLSVRHTHVPDLALSSLTNAKGTVAVFRDEPRRRNHRIDRPGPSTSFRPPVANNDRSAAATGRLGADGRVVAYRPRPPEISPQVTEITGSQIRESGEPKRGTGGAPGGFHAERSLPGNRG